MFPLEFCGEVKPEETRVMGLSSSEDPMMIAWVVLTQCQRVTDGRTDGRTVGRTDGFTIAHTALCIARDTARFNTSAVNNKLVDYCQAPSRNVSWPLSSVSCLSPTVFIFQVLQIPGLRFGPSFSWYCIWQGLHFQSPLLLLFVHPYISEHQCMISTSRLPMIFGTLRILTTAATYRRWTDAKFLKEYFVPIWL